MTGIARRNIAKNAKQTENRCVRENLQFKTIRLSGQFNRYK